MKAGTGEAGGVSDRKFLENGLASFSGGHRNRIHPGGTTFLHRQTETPARLPVKG